MSQRDADNDGIENSLDVCALVANSEWNGRISIRRMTLTRTRPAKRNLTAFPMSATPTRQSRGRQPNGCKSGYTGSDEDQDCFANRADNCPVTKQLENPALPPDQDTNKPLARTTTVTASAMPATPARMQSTATTSATA